MLKKLLLKFYNNLNLITYSIFLKVYIDSENRDKIKFAFIPF